MAERRAVALRAPLHFCAADMVSCYDNIAQGQLFSALHAALAVADRPVFLQKRVVAHVPAAERLSPRFFTEARVPTAAAAA